MLPHFPTSPSFTQKAWGTSSPPKQNMEEGAQICSAVQELRALEEWESASGPGTMPPSARGCAAG